MERIMESYTNFSEVYDTFMDQTPYDEWADNFYRQMTAGGREFNPVVDLGCGTGRMTQMLYDKGCEIIGLDLSEDMLSIAENRRLQSGSDILYVHQDMRKIELPGKVRTFISAGDSVNYLLEDEDILKMMRAVYAYLEEDGLFIFDFKTLHLYRDVIGEQTIAEDREDCSFIWDNYYHADEHLNEYDLSVFIRRPELGENIFNKYEEIHFQRGYTVREMKMFAAAAGFKWVCEYDSDNGEAVDEESERILVVLKK